MTTSEKPQGCTHEEYFRSFTPRGENIWQCEDCGATTLETDVDESEDGFGKRETPLWEDQNTSWVWP